MTISLRPITTKASSWTGSRIKKTSSAFGKPIRGCGMRLQQRQSGPRRDRWSPQLWQRRDAELQCWS
eukprot:7962696-Pyramimonas_sp.AAC.1